MSQPLSNKRVLVTAGPTREAIDPVRYISNHSSGKMGYAIAGDFLEKGAEVWLVSGPVSVSIDTHPALKVFHVTSAQEMYAVCLKLFPQTDIAVFAAAVADYRPETIAYQKIKKKEDSFSVRMVKNPDIAFAFGKMKNDRQLSVGFALETNDELTNAIAKLRAKNFDMVVLNSTNDKNATFGYDTNKVTIVKNDFTQLLFPLKSKSEVAKDVVAAVADLVIQDHKAEVSGVGKI